jgi:hypothetical protein
MKKCVYLEGYYKFKPIDMVRDEQVTLSPNRNISDQEGIHHI